MSDLEDALIEVIQDYLRTKEDKEKAKQYFYGVLVNELIDDAVEGNIWKNKK